MNVKKIIPSVIFLFWAAVAGAAIPTMLQPQIMQDGSVQLRWQSEVGAVYSIESTETLSLNSDGKMPFSNRDIRVN